MFWNGTVCIEIQAESVCQFSDAISARLAGIVRVLAGFLSNCPGPEEIALAIYLGRLAFENEDDLPFSRQPQVFTRQLQGRLGADRIINTAGLLLLAIRRGTITVADADRAKAILEARSFRMKFHSFADLTE